MEDRYIGMIYKVFQPAIKKKPANRNGYNESYSDPANKLFI